MPVHARIDATARLLVVEEIDDVSHDERLDAMRRWIADPGFRPDLDTLLDLTSARSAPSLSELRGMLAFDNQRRHEIGFVRIAVVTNQPVVYGAFRQFQALAESNNAPFELRLFSERQTALAWLRPRD